MRRSWRGTWFAASLCALPLLAEAQQAAPAPEAAATVNAVWVERKASFTYMPLTSYYSCDGLRDKVRWLLRQLGARPDFTVRSRGCVELQGPEAFPGVEIVAAFPAAATPDPLVEATAQFRARARLVELQSAPTTRPGLQDGDCELMEQLVRQGVFGKLGVKVVEAETRCVPRQVTLGAVRMTVEVLEPVPER